MYGMVNQAIEQMVLRAHGPDVWRDIQRRAGLTVEGFISNEAYPDEVTYQLVGAASECLGQPAERILHAFGEHWVLHTAREHYGPMLAATGSTLPELLEHLPRLHDRVVLIYPKLMPPRIEVTDRAERSLRLHYTSTRPGLAPFMGGLLSGLGQLFGTPTKVTLERPRGAAGGTDIFRVEW